MDPRRRSTAAAILTNIHFHPGNATTLYKAEIKLKFAALLRLRGMTGLLPCCCAAAQVLLPYCSYKGNSHSRLGGFENFLNLEPPQPIRRSAPCNQRAPALALSNAYCGTLNVVLTGCPVCKSGPGIPKTELQSCLSLFGPTAQSLHPCLEAQHEAGAADCNVCRPESGSLQNQAQEAAPPDQAHRHEAKID
eukprot:1161922-Pelagomonas_calceolata.AAC.7